MSELPIELSNIRIFDVLRNSLNSELGAVVGVEGDKIALVVRTGEIVRFKYGSHFSRVGEEEARAFRALTQALRREKLKAKPRRRRTARKPA